MCSEDIVSSGLVWKDEGLLLVEVVGVVVCVGHGLDRQACCNRQHIVAMFSSSVVPFESWNHSAFLL
jgi:hypothetical protein